MPTGVLDRTRELVAANNEQRYERWRYESMLTDELTDQSERLAKPMVNPFIYERDEQGKIYKEFDGKRCYLETVLDEGYDASVKMAWLQPDDWGFERVRRGIEREELDEVQKLEDGEKMMVISIIPDAVREGRTNINGYDRKRLKTIVRLFERNGDEMPSISFSLDQSNYEGLQFAAATVGVEIPDGLSSEDLLAKRYRFSASDELSLQEVYDSVRDSYDLYVGRQLGDEWYAGRPAVDTVDALSFIKAQPDLIAQHMNAVQQIMAKVLSEDERKRMLEAVRYDFAAALDFRMDGREVNMLSDAGDMARSEGRSYTGDCATGTATDQAGQMGYGQGKSAEQSAISCTECKLGITHNHECVNCPLCKKQNVTARYTKIDITCVTGCKKTLNKKTGEITTYRGGIKLDDATLSQIIDGIIRARKLKKWQKEEAEAIHRQ